MKIIGATNGGKDYKGKNAPSIVKCDGCQNMVWLNSTKNKNVDKNKVLFLCKKCKKS